ncbi:MAG: hypothetical protein HQK54_16255, partial [Oligoflexales bacterium]|nr:hypothetical protein [Oligoflexales bacterium]
MAGYLYSITPLIRELFEKQIHEIDLAEKKFFHTMSIRTDSLLAKRVFSSDIENQSIGIAMYRKNQEIDCFFSMIQQPPAMGANLGIMGMGAINSDSLKRQRHGGRICFDAGTSEARHIFFENLTCDDTSKNIEAQTRSIFEQMERGLNDFHTTISDSVLRTWIYLGNIEADYTAMVKARREIFEKINLIGETHYISSTGIEGKTHKKGSAISMDAWAAASTQKNSVRYIEAPEYMCPAHFYGATFERATCISISDIDLLTISGTASIDRDGNIMHVGNIGGQTERTVENIEALLKTAGFDKQDLAGIIVYVKETGFLMPVRNILERCWPGLPAIYVKASVCRTDWLVEIEGLAAR